MVLLQLTRLEDVLVRIPVFSVFPSCGFSRFSLPPSLFPSSLHLFFIPSLVLLVFGLRSPSSLRQFVPCFSVSSFNVVPSLFRLCSVFVPSLSVIFHLVPLSSVFFSLPPPSSMLACVLPTSCLHTGMFWFWFCVSHLKCTLLLLHCVDLFVATLTICPYWLVFVFPWSPDFLYHSALFY